MTDEENKVLSLKTTRQCFAQKIFHDFDGRSIFITFWSSWWSIEMEENINNSCALKTETLTKSNFSKLSVDMMGDAKRRRYQILDFSYLIFRGGASHSGIVYCTKPSCSSTQYQLPPMQLSGPSRVQFTVYSLQGTVCSSKYKPEYCRVVDTSVGVSVNWSQVGKFV